jgi:lipopolysaccharide export LptBFGC system permease protein LptF
MLWILLIGTVWVLFVEILILKLLNQQNEIVIVRHSGISRAIRTRPCVMNRIS